MICLCSSPILDPRVHQFSLNFGVAFPLPGHHYRSAISIDRLSADAAVAAAIVAMVVVMCFFLVGFVVIFSMVFQCIK